MKTIGESTSFTGKGIKQLLHAMSLPETNSANSAGTFKGKIISAKTGARVFGVVVELVGTGLTYVTSPSGYFKITNVPEGIYLARFSYPGFKEVAEAIAILNDEPLDLTLSLEVSE